MWIFKKRPEYCQSFLDVNPWVTMNIGSLILKAHRRLFHLSNLVSTIILGMLESSGLRKYSTPIAFHLFYRGLCLCLCICVLYSFLNSYYHKLSENVWVWGCGATRSEIWLDVTIAGRTDKRMNERTMKDRPTQPMDHGRLR